MDIDAGRRVTTLNRRPVRYPLDLKIEKTGNGGNNK